MNILRIAATDNGLTLIQFAPAEGRPKNDGILLCWDGDYTRPAGTGEPFRELANMTPRELREIMQTGEDWQAAHEGLRHTLLYQWVSSYMQHVKSDLARAGDRNGLTPV